MQSFMAVGGRELPFILLLIALLGFRWRVTPKVSVFVAAPLHKVFALLDFREGDEQRWQRTRVRCRLIDEATNTYRLSFTTAFATGASHASEADFRVVKREPPYFLVIDRAGLESRSENNQLLQMRAELSPERGGSRRLLDQILARADLWGSAFRLKGMAERDQPDYRSDALISAGVAMATGVVTLATFALAFGWIVAPLLVAALLFHEYGHLLAFRLIGQPWGRLIFLPFLGAIAVPRIGFSTQAQSVFAAIMGPALSVVIPLLVAGDVWFAGENANVLMVFTGVVVAALNLFNLLPVEPLDGGVVLRSVMARLFGAHARFGMIAVGALIVAAGWIAGLPLILVFGGLAIVANLRPRTIDPGLQPLSSLQVTISAFGFMSVVAAYAVLLRYLLANALLAA